MTLLPIVALWMETHVISQSSHVCWWPKSSPKLLLLYARNYQLELALKLHCRRTDLLQSKPMLVCLETLIATLRYSDVLRQSRARYGTRDYSQDAAQGNSRKLPRVKRYLFWRVVFSSQMHPSPSPDIYSAEIYVQRARLSTSFELFLSDCCVIARY